MTSTYASARADVATAITTAMTGWSVYDHPTDALDDKSIALSMQGSAKQGPNLWRRELIVGVFVRRDAVAEGFDQLDTAVPTIAAVDVDGLVVGDPTEPRVVTLAESEYLAVFIPVTIETTN